MEDAVVYMTCCKSDRSYWNVGFHLRPNHYLVTIEKWVRDEPPPMVGYAIDGKGFYQAYTLTQQATIKGSISWRYETKQRIPLDVREFVEQKLDSMGRLKAFL